MKDVIFFLGSWIFTITLSVAIDQTVGKYISEDSSSKKYIK